MLVHRESSLRVPGEFSATIFFSREQIVWKNSHCSQLTKAQSEIWQPAGLESSFVFFLFPLRQEEKKTKENKKPTRSVAALITG